MNKRILSLVLALVIVLGSGMTVFAADFDLIHTLDSAKNTHMLNFMEELEIFEQVTGDFSNYELELNGKRYSVQDIQDKLDAGAVDLEDAIAKIEVPEEPTGDLEVVEISAINGTEVTLSLSGVGEELPETAIFSVKDSNGNVYAPTDIAKVSEGVYTLTLGTAVEGVGVLTVAVGETQATMAFDTTTQGVSLEMMISDEDSVLRADGADNTIVTVKTIRDGEAVTNVTGTVKFISLKGAKFAKTEVALDKGVAKVQLTSMSSPVEIEDILIAMISDANDTDFIGQRTEIGIRYVPQGGEAEVGEKVFPTYAESDSADHLFIKFNKAVNFEDLYADWAKSQKAPLSTQIIQVKVVDKGVVQTRTPIGLEKINDNTIKVVFDEANQLIDNSEVTVITRTSSAATGTLLASENIKFNLVDHKAPAALEVSNPDYRTIVAHFNEAVAATGDGKAGGSTIDYGNAETPGNWVLNGYKLKATDIVGGKPLVGKAYTNEKDITTHETYVANSTKPVDNRGYVTIVLTAQGAKNLKAAGSNNLLQAYNIRDYASNSDKSGQNVATTQEFEFKTPAAPAAPTAVITTDSPEQFRVKFSTDVQVKNASDLKAANFKFEYQTGVNSSGVKTYKELNLVDTLTPGGNANEAIVNKIANDEYLIELNRDWTQILNTSSTKTNYYTPDKNHVKITVEKDKIENLQEVAMLKDQVQELKLSLDDVGPKHKSMEQVFDNKGVAQQLIKVVMEEPVQMYTADAAKDTNEITPSQKQSGEVPAVTFDFISEDKTKTIQGQLRGKISEDDMTFYIEPKDNLTSGNWTVYVRSISDDVGNTSDTVNQTLNIVAKEAAVGEASIVWAQAFDDDIDKLQVGAIADQDVVYIQFGAEMSIDAAKSSIYTINGKSIPETSSVETSLANYYIKDGSKYNVFTGTRVTITLPKDFLSNGNAQENMLNVSKQLLADDGTALAGPTEVELKYNAAGIDIKDETITGNTIVGDVYLRNNIVTIDATGTTFENDVYILDDQIVLNGGTTGIVKGNVYLDPGADETATLKNIIVQGDIIIMSGGTSSIHLDNVKAKRVVVKDDETIKVHLEGTTTVEVLEAETPVTINIDSGASIDLLEVKSDKVKLSGTVSITTVKDINVSSGVTVDASVEGVQDEAAADALLSAADLSALAFTEDIAKNETDNVAALQVLVDALSLDAAITATASVVSGNYVVTLTTANATAPRVDTIAAVTTTDATVADALLAAADLSALAFTEDIAKNEADNITDLQALVDALGLDAAITATVSVVGTDYVVTLTTANATAPRVDTIAAVTTTDATVADALLSAADLSALAFTEDIAKNEADNITDLQALVNALGLDAAITATVSVVGTDYVVTLTTANATAPRVDTIAAVTTTV